MNLSMSYIDETNGHANRDVLKQDTLSGTKKWMEQL